MGAELIRDLTAYLALVVAVSSLMGHWRAQRKAAMEEGARVEQTSRMKQDLDRVFEKIRTMEGCFHTRDLEMEGVKKDIAYIKETVDEIKDAVKRLTPR